MGHLSKVLERTYKIGTLVWTLVGRFKEKEFILDWVLSRSGYNSLIMYLNKSHLGQMRAKLTLSLVKQQQ